MTSLLTNEEIQSAVRADIKPKQLMFSTGELVMMANLSGLPRGIRPNELEAFVALVAERAVAAEREACEFQCALVAAGSGSEQHRLGANECFDRIRARKPL